MEVMELRATSDRAGPCADTAENNVNSGIMANRTNEDAGRPKVQCSRM